MKHLLNAPLDNLCLTFYSMVTADWIYYGSPNSPAIDKNAYQT